MIQDLSFEWFLRLVVTSGVPSLDNRFPSYFKMSRPIVYGGWALNICRTMYYTWRLPEAETCRQKSRCSAGGKSRPGASDGPGSLGNRTVNARLFSDAILHFPAVDWLSSDPSHPHPRVQSRRGYSSTTAACCDDFVSMTLSMHSDLVTKLLPPAATTDPSLRRRLHLHIENWSHWRK